MDIDSALESISLWGVLHEGELRKVISDADLQSVVLEIIVPHLSEFYGWPGDRGIRLDFSGVTGLRVNQWTPEPSPGNENIGSRRWSQRKWEAFESSVPDHWLAVSDANILTSRRGCKLLLSGYERGPMESGDLLLELVIQGSELRIFSPDGPVSVDKLVQLGDAYWDNLGKKKKKQA